jgi:hypothetical protein
MIHLDTDVEGTFRLLSSCKVAETGFDIGVELGYKRRES